LEAASVQRPSDIRDATAHIWFAYLKPHAPIARGAGECGACVIAAGRSHPTQTPAHHFVVRLGVRHVVREPAVSVLVELLLRLCERLPSRTGLDVEIHT
jgi:hypothetical protein